MVVRIRLARFGRKHRPFYRIVVADARSPRATAATSSASGRTILYLARTASRRCG